MPAARTREDRVLTTACRLGDEQTLLPSDLALDWDHLIKRASRLGILPHLHHFFRRQSDLAVPTEVREELARRYYAAAGRNAVFHEALREALAVLAERGIATLVLKGAALAETVYENIALRPMKDLDLMVRASDLDKAAREIVALGYRPNEDYRSEAWYREELHHLAPFYALRGPAIIELHRNVIPPAVSVRVPNEMLWRRSRSAEVAGVPCLVLAPDDLLLHLCVHIGAVDGFLGRLRGLRDLAEVIRHYEAELDWDRLLASFRRYQAVRYGHACLGLAGSLLDATVPQGVLESLEREASVGSLSARWSDSVHRRLVLKYEGETATIPGDVLALWSAQLMRGRSWSATAGAVVNALSSRWTAVGRRRGFKRLAPAYGLVIHPVVLLARALRRIVGFGAEEL